MNKKTHVLLVRRYMQGRVSQLELKALCIGTFLTDLGVMCFCRPHTYARHKDRIVGKCQGVSPGGSGFWYWLKVGYLAHYLADFYTEPHNRDKFVQFCSHHRRYEADLHAYFLAHLWKVGQFDGISGYSLEKRLVDMHVQYLQEMGTAAVDFEYITEEVCLFLEYCLGSS